MNIPSLISVLMFFFGFCLHVPLSPVTPTISFNGASDEAMKSYTLLLYYIGQREPVRWDYPNYILNIASIMTTRDVSDLTVEVKKNDKLEKMAIGELLELLKSDEKTSVTACVVSFKKGSGKSLEDCKFELQPCLFLLSEAFFDNLALHVEHHKYDVEKVQAVVDGLVKASRVDDGMGNKIEDEHPDWCNIKKKISHMQEGKQRQIEIGNGHKMELSAGFSMLEINLCRDIAAGLSKEEGDKIWNAIIGTSQKPITKTTNQILVEFKKVLEERSNRPQELLDRLEGVLNPPQEETILQKGRHVCAGLSVSGVAVVIGTLIYAQKIRQEDEAFWAALQRTWMGHGAKVTVATSVAAIILAGLAGKGYQLY